MPVGSPVRVTVTALALLTAGLAGCLAGDEGAGPGIDDASRVDLDAFVNPMIEGHDHADPAAHRLAWNMARTGGTLLDEGLRGFAGPHALDVKAGKLFVSAWAATGDDVAGVYVFDLEANPADPPLLGKVTWHGAAAGDRNMEATADGEWIVVGLEGWDCAGNVNPFEPGVWLIDATDPTNPVVVDRQPVVATSLGWHSVTVHSTDTGDYVYHGGGDDTLYVIDRDAGALVEAGTFQSGHDSTLFHDPIEDRMLLLSADVSHLTIYDVTEPATPRAIGSWDVPDPDLYYVHTAVADHVHGRNVAIVNSEDFRDAPTAFWVLDITDPATPVTLAQWTAPDDVESGHLKLSLHNPRIQDGILTFSFYHAGVWQFDLNDPERWEDPRPRAYYLPHEPVGRFAAPDGSLPISLVCGTLLNTYPGRLDIPLDAVPFTFDVALYGEYVYAADLNTGIHVLRFDPDVGLVGFD